MYPTLKELQEYKKEDFQEMNSFRLQYAIMLASGCLDITELEDRKKRLQVIELATSELCARLDDTEIKLYVEQKRVEALTRC